MSSIVASRFTVSLLAILMLQTFFGQPGPQHLDAHEHAMTHEHAHGTHGQVQAVSETQTVSETDTTTVSDGGMWGPVIEFPLVPASAVMLRNNKLLTFSAYSATQFNRSADLTQVAIYDLNTGSVTAPRTVDTNHQMFCSGITLLANGNVLISGGSSDRATTIYNPVTNAWSIGPRTTISRAYQGNTLLSDGRVFTVGGSWYDGDGGKNGEVYSAAGGWNALTNVLATNILTNDPAGVYRADNHAWLFATAGGGVFHAGPSKRMNWITTSGEGSVKTAGLRGGSPDAMNGNAVMYDVGKILVAGGSTAYEGVAARTDAYKIDISGGPTRAVTTTRVGNMAYARAYSNGVALPDGTVMISGGQPMPRPFTDTDAVRNPEIWNPATGSFSTMNPEAEARTYHSVAVLLSDGRVFSGGGGLCSACTTRNDHLSGQIFSPPYLVNADGTNKVRPVIKTAPGNAAPGATITVTTDSATPRFALMRASGVTHTVNNDQRRIPIQPTLTGTNTYTLTIPANRGVALPGYYMLFGLNAAGTPSVAKYIRIG